MLSWDSAPAPTKVTCDAPCFWLSAFLLLRRTGLAEVGLALLRLAFVKADVLAEEFVCRGFTGDR